MFKLMLFEFIHLIAIIFKSINGQQILTFSEIACNFDGREPFCNWKPSTDSIKSLWEFKTRQYTGLQFTGAIKPVSGTDKFIQVYNKDNIADLVSPLISSTIIVNCFTFYYYIHGEGVRDIQLQLISKDVTQTIWQRHESAGDMWHKYDINIGPQNSNFNLKFNVASGSGAIALDMFAGKAGQCEQSSLCDFEGGACQWTSKALTNANYIFKLTQANNKTWQSSADINEYDHSTESNFGHFMEAYGGNLNDVTMLTSPVLNDVGDYCLKFWFWRHVSSNNLIQVQKTGPGIGSADNIIWKSNYSYPNKLWHRGLVDFSSYKGAQIIIKAIRAKDSIIDIDDISLETNTCPKQIDCDFNADMCGWTRDLAKEWIWDHGIGRLANATKVDFKSPPFDRQSPDSGMFMFTDFTLLESNTKSTMVMNSEYVPATAASCLTFYYIPLSFVDSSNAFQITLLDQTGTILKSAFVYNYQNDPQSKISAIERKWSKQTIDINSAQTFRISIIVSTTKSTTYMAIDDITYRAGSCAQTPLTTVAPIFPTTSSALELACNFEDKSKPTCNWISDQDLSWTNADGIYFMSASYDLMPRFDHTLETSSGRFAFVAHSQDDFTQKSISKRTASMTITDNAVQGYKGPVCFTLWYWMETTEFAQLNTTVKSPQNIITSQLIRSGDHYEQWNQLEFETVENSTGYIYTISASISYGTIAVDDITALYGLCPQTDPQLFRCTFEGGHNCSFTPVYHPAEKYLFFTLYQGLDTYVKVYDHTYKTTLGHYYALDFHGLNMIAQITSANYKILSKSFPPTQGTCVTFSYYMYGLNNNETLNVYIQKENFVTTVPLWKVTGNMGPLWYSHRMTIKSTLSWQLAFDVSAYESKEGLIAIDDVIVELDKPCPPKGKCDFERKDTCMWESIPANSAIKLSQDEKLRLSKLIVGSKVMINDLKYTDFEWEVYSRDYKSEPNQLNPLNDHTLDRRTGNYLLMRSSAPRTPGDRAVLVSDHYDIDPKNSSFCFSLFYIFRAQSQTNINTYPRFEVFQSENYTQVIKIGEITGLNLTSDWTEFRVTAKPSSSASVNMWFYLVGDVGSNTAIIAIDDISITTGDCVKPDPTFDCGPTESILQSKVCDGVKDCTNGLDELDCGSCVFNNKDLCGYKPGNVSESDKSYQWRFGNSTIGPKSAYDDSNNFIVASTFEANSLTAVNAELHSPTILSSAAGCYIRFIYNIFGNTSQLSVQIDRSGEESVEILNSNAVVNIAKGKWNTGVATIDRINTKFSVKFIASQGLTYDLSPFVALSNLMMIGCRIDKKESCHPGEFKCDNGNCVDTYGQCDFVDDCGDNSDEKPSTCSLYASRCDFEDGFCDWSRGRTRNAVMSDWHLFDGYSTVLDGPTRDHTKGIRTGHYLAMRSYSLINHTSTSDGPILEPTSNCFMTIWITMEGNGTLEGNLNIQAQNLDTGHVTDLWKSVFGMFPLNRFTFDRKVIDLTGQPSTFKLLLKGYLQEHGDSKMISYVAVDDITLSPGCKLSTANPGQLTTTPGPTVTTPNVCEQTVTGFSRYQCANMKCIDWSLICNFHDDCGDQSDESLCGACSFDNNTMCGWNNIGAGKAHWEVKQLHGLPTPDLPDFDANVASNGGYLIINSIGGGTSDLPAKISSPQWSSTGPNCKMTFSYRHLNPKGTLGKLKIELRQPGPRFNIEFIKELLVITENTDWKSYSVSIGELGSNGSPRWEIRISGEAMVTTNSYPYADLEIDEINFVNCDASGPTLNTTLDCDFENGTCGWVDKDIGSDKQIDWERTRDDHQSPGHDHTSKLRPTPARYGTWIYTKRMSGMSGTNLATLITANPQPSTTGPKCLTFWYHLFGKDAANFSLYVNHVFSLTGNPQLLWIKRMPQSNNWVKAQVDIPAQAQPYYLMFNALLIAKSDDTVGLDDITYTDGTCPPSQLCDFEVDTCNWKINQGDFVRQAHTDNVNRLPAVDHTLGAADGHFIKVNRATSTELQMSYTITNGMTSKDKLDICLKLWVYFGGSPEENQNRFDITVPNMRTASLWTYDLSVDNLLNQWVYNRYNFYIGVNETVSIEAMITNESAVLAFDDIQVLSQSCEQPGWCDFETDFCGWSNAHIDLNKTQVLWTRNSGDTEANGSGPRMDHTTNSEEGWYLFVPLDAQEVGVAILQSEVLDPFWLKTICFTFFYHMLSIDSNTTPKLSVLYSAIGETNPRFIGNISSTTGEWTANQNKWQNFNITLKNLPKGRFIFRTYSGQTSKADVAIDDISIKQNTCEELTHPSTTTTSRPLTTPEPIAQKQWDCDFESTTCNWTVGTEGWTKTSWQTMQSLSKSVGPRADHTMGTKSGHYLLYDGSNTNAPNPVSLTSTKITISHNAGYVCLSFWYYVDSESKFNLTMGYIMPTNPNKFILHYDNIRNSIYTRKWKQSKLEYYLQKDYMLSIRLEHSTPFNGGVAIDDIILTLGNCVLTDEHECDFSNGYCGYEFNPVSLYGIGIGSIKTGAQKNASGYTNGPMNDHSSDGPNGNYFLFMKPELSADYQYTTEIIIKNLTSTGIGANCLKFWYQINALNASALWIYVEPVTATQYMHNKWEPLSNNITQWTQGQLTIQAEYNHKIIFSFSRPKGAPDYFFVSLDDISITHGACELEVSCDFDTDLCSYNNIITIDSNWNWGRYIAPPAVGVPWNGPAYDHTFGRDGGSYLYLTIDKTTATTTPKIGVIESQPVRLNAIQCLTLFTQLIGNDSSIEVSILLNTNEVKVLNRLNGTGTAKVWKQSSTIIDANKYKNSSIYWVRIKGQVNNLNSFVALDDIKLSNGTCADTSQTVFFCTNGTQLDLSKVCDFANDCAQGEDELNCGACDFETDTCGWDNKYTQTTAQQWIRKVANNYTSPMGPVYDGRGSPMGHYMLVNDSSAPTSVLRPILTNSKSVTNQLKKCYETCEMSFQYYMNVSNVQDFSAHFVVNIRSTVESYNTIWRTGGDQGSKWVTDTVYIGEQDRPFQIEFTGADPGFITMLAIDNIFFQSCSPPKTTIGQCSADQFECSNNKVCINAYVLCDGMNDCGDNWDELNPKCTQTPINKCDFENVLKDNVFCYNWTQERDSGSEANWHSINALTASRDTYLRRLTGPPSDHTYRRYSLGTFLSLNGSEKDFGKKSRFVSPMVVSRSGQSCALRLFYYMFGESTQMGSLAITVRNADPNIKVSDGFKPFSQKGNVGQQWRRAIVWNADQRPFQFVIEGTVGTGNRADIAIDDISFSDGCLSSDQKPITTSSPNTGKNPSYPSTESTVGPNGVPLGNKNEQTPNANGAKIAAGVLVPIFVIGAILGVLFYRRSTNQKNREDRITFPNRVYYRDGNVETVVNHN